MFACLAPHFMPPPTDATSSLIYMLVVDTGLGTVAARLVPVISWIYLQFCGSLCTTETRCEEHGVCYGFCDISAASGLYKDLWSSGDTVGTLLPVGSVGACFVQGRPFFSSILYVSVCCSWKVLCGNIKSL